MAFDPTQFGATPVTGSFNPSDFGATEISSQPKVDTSQMPRSRLTGNYSPSQPGGLREYLDENTGQYVPENQASIGQKAKALAETFLDPAAKALGSAAKVPQDIVSSIMNHPTSDFQMKLPSGKTSSTIQHEFETQTIPDVTSGKTSPLAGTADVVGQTVGGAATFLGGGAAKEGVQAGADTAADIASYMKGRLEGGDKTFESALKDVTPNFEKATPTEKGNLISQPAVNGTPRVQEGGFFSGRSVTSTPHEAEVANKLSTIPGYKPNMTALDKSNLVNDQIAKEGNQMRASLQNEPFIAPPKEIVSVVRKAVNAVPQNSLLLQKSDPVIANYLRVVNNSASNMTGNLEGVLNLKQTLDAAYENARGKLAFGSDSSSALDEVHTAARDALTQYMIKNAQNTNVKLALRSQWLLYKASDVITKKAAKEGTSGAERLLDSHPVLKTGVGIIKKAVPFGLGAHIVP